MEYSEKGSHAYELEQQAWINFIDFLDDCAGMFIDRLISQSIFTQMAIPDVL